MSRELGLSSGTSVCYVCPSTLSFTFLVMTGLVLV